MQDPQRNALGQIGPSEPEAVSQVGEDRTQTARINPWDWSSRDPDEVLVWLKRGDERKTWLFAGALVAVFGLGWAGGSNWYRFSNIEAAFNPLTQEVTSSRRICDSEIKSARKIDGVVRRATSATGLQSSNALPAPAAGMPLRAQNHSLEVTNLIAAYSSAASSAGQANTNPPGGSVIPRDTMVPVPETRPTTIEGWTVRDVRGGTAILEGPDRVWTATRGDTVPGVGRIDSIVRWGNRWIVATASGLIAMP
jgi:hypothetical protein